jgi:hypothetical protein
MILQKILRIDFYSFYFDTSILYRTFARSFFACMDIVLSQLCRTIKIIKHEYSDPFFANKTIS